MEKIQGIAVFQEGKPSAKPLIFIHGFPMSHEMWKPQTDFFSKTHRVISYDLRGQGQSEVGDGQYTVESYVDDLIAVMDHLKLEKAVICGLSMGGYIALRAMQREAKRFAGIVLCDTKSEADNDEAKLKRAGTLGHIKKTGMVPFSQEFVKFVFSEKTLAANTALVSGTQEIMNKNSALGVCGALLALAARTDTTAALEKITVPALVIVGEEDKITPLTSAQAMLKKIPHASLQIIPGAAHFSNLENPAEFNRVLSGFLSKI